VSRKNPLLQEKKCGKGKKRRLLGFVLFQEKFLGIANNFCGSLKPKLIEFFSDAKKILLDKVAKQFFFACPKIFFSWHKIFFLAQDFIFLL